jgi:hypothetical protein
MAWRADCLPGEHRGQNFASSVTPIVLGSPKMRFTKPNEPVL